MKKKSIQVYNILIPIKDLTAKQKIIISQILYMIYKNKSDMNDIDINNDLKIKVSKLLGYKKQTIENALNKAVDLKILGTTDSFNYYIYSSRYIIDKKSKYISIPFDIFLNGDLTETQKLILAYCYSYTNKNRSCKISNNYIANELCISKNEVKKLIAKLKKLGFIKSTFDMKGCVAKNRQIYIDEENLHELYVEYVERIETEKIEKIKKAEEIKTDLIENVEEVKNVENIDKIETVEKIETIGKIEQLNLFNLTEFIEYFKNATLPREDAQRLYFNVKKSFEIVKEIYNKAIQEE